MWQWLGRASGALEPLVSLYTASKWYYLLFKLCGELTKMVAMCLVVC